MGKINAAHELLSLRNVGPAIDARLTALGISTIAQLVHCDADTLFMRLCADTGSHHDPCVHDVFSAAIHQARTGEARDWWHFTPARKARQIAGTFPQTGV